MLQKGYLLNVSISGIKNISKEIRLDFYKKVINKNFNPEKYRIKAIYGENGAGKTAIVTALGIVKNLYENGQYLSQRDTQIFLSEIVNKETNVFTFSAEYLYSTSEFLNVYNYSIEIGLDANNQYVIKREQLKEKNGNTNTNAYKVVYEVFDGELTFANVDEHYMDIISDSVRNLLSYKLFSCAYIGKPITENGDDVVMFSIHTLLNYIFFSSIQVFLDSEDQHMSYLFSQMRENIDFNDMNSLQNLARLSEKQEVYFNSKNRYKVDKKYFDKFEKKISQLEKFIKLFKKELKAIEIEKRDDGYDYKCELIFDYGIYKVNSEFESTGIKKLIRLFDSLLAASQGNVVFVDEMDSNINDIYFCKMIEYFMYYGKGQLIFTTHNLDPMSYLKENKNSIDFISIDNRVVSWASKGNAKPENYYRNGMIVNSPFNIDAVDFIGIFGD